MRRALVVVGKPPLPGLVKTRLCPPLTPTNAAALHTAFLRDTIALAHTVAGSEVIILYPPMPGDQAAFAATIGPTVRLLVQTGSGLGAALNGASSELLADGFDQVALISSDNPNLPAEYLAAAFDALTEADVALGPAEDGGYYLIALRQAHPGLFQDIQWSTAVVLTQTLERATGLGLTVSLLPSWYDVDEVDGLRRLAADLAIGPTAVASHTRAFLRHHYPTGL